QGHGLYRGHHQGTPGRPRSAYGVAGPQGGVRCDGIKERSGSDDVGVGHAGDGLWESLFE
ncbi:MAG: hypothetical protein F6K09_31205, partial [Merismopedia sp. SIO2A8]|nr:hypothetical protein [Merismopedia sp. SIO2A8]